MQIKTYSEEFQEFDDATRWLEGHLEDYSDEYRGIWVITQVNLHFQGGLYKCVFSVSNQKAMS